MLLYTCAELDLQVWLNEYMYTSTCTHNPSDSTVASQWQLEQSLRQASATLNVGSNRVDSFKPPIDSARTLLDNSSAWHVQCTQYNIDEHNPVAMQVLLKALLHNSLIKTHSHDTVLKQWQHRHHTTALKYKLSDYLCLLRSPGVQVTKQAGKWIINILMVQGVH